MSSLTVSIVKSPWSIDNSRFSTKLAKSFGSYFDLTVKFFFFSTVSFLTTSAMGFFYRLKELSLI